MTTAAIVASELDRLSGTGPVGVACSGGGDSLALLVLATEWARQRDRRLHVFTVDHGLRAGSDREAAFVASVAAELGWPCDRLVWADAQGGPGLQARARQARHKLLARACRARNVDTLLLAHTRNDQAETLALRLAAGGSWRSAAAMPPAAPSPAWPDGRDLQLVRPCLELDRDSLRRELEMRALRWVEDPSNADRRFARIRMRDRLATWSEHIEVTPRLARLAAALQAARRSEQAAAWLAARSVVTLSAWGGASLDRSRWTGLLPVVRLAVLEALVPALSGQALTPARAQLEPIDAAIAEGRALTGCGVSLLAGPDGHAVLIRDRGALLGRVDQPPPELWHSEADGTRIFDGRFALGPNTLSLEWSVMGDTYEGLAKRAILDTVPGPARAGLLVGRDGTRIVHIAGLWTDAEIGHDRVEAAVRSLVAHRFCRRLLPLDAGRWFDACEVA